MLHGALGEQEDRRRHPRYEILAQVGVTYATVDYVLELTNISRSGALVQLGSLDKPAWVAQGRTIDLCITVPVDLDNIELSGRIVRLEQRKRRWGFAVEFSALTEAQQRGIDQLITLARRQPPPLPQHPQPPPLPMPNRRRHSRYQLLAAVRTRRDDEDLVLELTNISRSGALVQLGSLDKPPWLATGETVDLSIVDPTTLELTTVTGTVVRVEQRRRRWGFAVQFHPLDDQTRASVLHLCSLGRPPPAAAQPPKGPP